MTARHNQSAAALVAASELPRHEAERLLVVASGLTRSEIVLRESLPTDVVDRFAALAQRRRDGVPLQHLEGSVQFGPLELLIDGRALIPRPETEELWERAVAMVGRPAVIIDLCTGSGCLALALKHSFRAARVVASDISAEAIALATENGERTGLDVEFVIGDLFDPLPSDLCGTVDLFVANPPYLGEAELEGSQIELGHDPRRALVGGPLGTEIFSAIADRLREWLRPGGRFIVEIGADQGPTVAALFAHLDGRIHRDLQGRDRFVVGARPHIGS